MAPETATGTLVDSNVLLDILTEDPVRERWSSDSLADAAESGLFHINPIVYSEVPGGVRLVDG